jgi:glycosyltransferase involved in cell wall biosynthesis
MSVLVSVIVPVYNVEEHLDKCIESIINQTYHNLEIMLVDDGSTDSCPQKCDAWKEKDDRIKVIHKKNEGLGLARNCGLDCITGIYVTFVDSDDYLALDAIDTMLRRMERDESDLAVAKKIKVYSDGTQEAIQYYNWETDIVITRDEAMRMIGSSHTPFPASACAKLYRRELFNTVRFLDLKTAEDTCISPYIVDLCNKITLVNANVYYYFQRETSIVHNLSRERQIDGIKAMLIVARFLLDKHYINEARHYYRAAIYKLIELKYDRQARTMIRGAFSHDERKLLLTEKRSMIASILAYTFPQIYHHFKVAKSRSVGR